MHVAADLPLFLRRQNADLAWTVPGIDPLRATSVACRVQADAGPCQPFANIGTRLRVVLADTTGEHQCVDAMERRCHRGDLLAHGQREHADRQLGGRWFALDLSQASQVAADPLYSEQAGAVVDQALEGARVHALFARQPGEHARVQVAAARGHHHAAAGGHAHARVD